MSQVVKLYLRFVLFAGVVLIICIALELYGMATIVLGINQTFRCDLKT